EEAFLLAFRPSHLGGARGRILGHHRCRSAPERPQPRNLCFRDRQSARHAALGERASVDGACGGEIRDLTLLLTHCCRQSGSRTFQQNGEPLMITLFHRPKTRSSRFLWLLEELGAPYEIKSVTTRTRDGAGAIDPANPHPHGKVPAIQDSDDGTVVFESPAIVLYLTDKFPKAGIGPTVGDHDRGAYLSWLSYYTGVLEPAFMSKFMNVEVPV